MNYSEENEQKPITGTKEYILKRAAEIANHYAQSTGISCRIINDSILLDEKSNFCFCKIANDHSDKRIGPLCGRTHLHNARQAERFGGSFIYFCSSFLLYWSSPIIKDGVLIGAFIAGPAMMVTKEEVIEEWKKLYPSLTEDVFREYVDEIPIITPERSRSLSELLLMCAGWVRETYNSILVESREYQKQQSHISEYIHELKNSTSEESTVSYPIEKEDELLSAISRGNRDQAQRLLNEILGNVFFSSGRDFEIIKFRILELIILLSRASIDGGANPDDIFTYNYRYLREIEQFTNVDSLAYWLSGVLNRFASQVFNLQEVKHVDRLERTLHYINSHYTEKISLEDAASYAALSPAYFSKIFKEEMNCSFTIYINRIRIDHARTLLRTTPCTLIEISGLVGFEDQSYFSRVFKSIAGISPGKYRENSGKIQRDKQEIHS
jgi:two-component system, response regulator YesN